MFSRHLLLVLGAALLVSLARASDLNWGKKVPCFVVEGTVVCPGCNYRAGLTCPNSLKQQSCVPSTTQKTYFPRRRMKTTPTVTTTTTTAATPTSTTVATTTNSTVTGRVWFGRKFTKNPLDMSIFLYRILEPHELRRRYKRDAEPLKVEHGVWTPLEEDAQKDEVTQEDEEVVQQEEEIESCRWNGDCPCPQICCDAGAGCPKRCVRGVRLPPPWG